MDYLDPPRAHAYWLHIVCTDRGQHRRRILTNVVRELDGTRRMTNVLDQFSPPRDEYPADEPPANTPKDAFVFWCPACRRTPQVQREKWWALADTLGAAGHSDLDVSLLPY